MPVTVDSENSDWLST